MPSGCFLGREEDDQEGSDSMAETFVDENNKCDYVDEIWRCQELQSDVAVVAEFHLRQNQSSRSCVWPEPKASTPICVSECWECNPLCSSMRPTIVSPSAWMTSVVTLLDERSSLIKKRCILEMHRDELVECTPDTHTEVGKFVVSQMGLANNADTIKVGEDRFCFQDIEGFVLGVNTFSLPETWQLCPDVSVREDIRSVSREQPVEIEDCRSLNLVVCLRCDTCFRRHSVHPRMRPHSSGNQALNDVGTATVDIPAYFEVCLSLSRMKKWRALREWNGFKRLKEFWLVKVCRLSEWLYRSG